MTAFDSFYSITIITKISVLDVADILDPALITDIFAFAELDLIQFEANFPFL